MNQPKLLTPDNWKDYQLIDSGGGEKLERFGAYVVARPEPQALWDKSFPESEWIKADAAFGRGDALRNNDVRRGGRPDSPGATRGDSRNDERGEWVCRPGMEQQWWIEYAYKEMRLKLRLGLTSFKHVGLFPEQAENWNYLYDNLRLMAGRLGRAPRVLNLFAYTGGATLAARAAGAEVTHLDSVKQVVTWARENMEHSGLDGVRWIVDDAAKFVRKEISRGKKYDAIILDPPAYGRGPDGEKWVLEQDINGLLKGCAQLLERENALLLLNLYSMGLSALLAKGLANQLFGTPGKPEADQAPGQSATNQTPGQPKSNHAPENEEFGELYVEDRSGKALPLGIYYRFVR